jgi:hypothetical protein
VTDAVKPTQAKQWEPPIWVQIPLGLLIVVVVVAVVWRAMNQTERKADEEFCAKLTSARQGQIVFDTSKAAVISLGFPDTLVAGGEVFKIVWADSLSGADSFIIGHYYEVALDHTKATFYALRSIDEVDDCLRFTRWWRKEIASLPLGVHND